MLHLRRFNPFGTATREVLFIIYILGVMMITLLPQPEPYQSDHMIRLLPFEDIGRFLRSGRGVRNVAGNVLLFLPLGLFWARHSFIRVLLLAGLASLSIELAQLGLSLFAGANRTTSLDDVILNTSGAALGYAVATALQVRGRASRPTGNAPIGRPKTGA